MTRLPALLGFGAIFVFVMAAFTPMANLLVESVTVPQKIGPADAIVVLASGGVSPSGMLSDTSLRRTVHGIDLYFRRLAPLVVFSGNDPDESRAESRIRAELAQKFGVPRATILTASGTHTTREEAARVKSLLWPRGVRTILLVTDGDHMIRAAPVFEHVGFTVLAAPVTEVDWDFDPGRRLSTLGRTLREIVGVIYYRSAGYL